MTLERSLELLASELGMAGVEWALIGGLGLAARGALRSTGDIDLLVLAQASDDVHGVMTSLGYERRHHSSDVANYRSTSDRLCDVDFLLAHRPYALKMLERASEEDLGVGSRVRVLQAEDLVGLKVQSSSNDPRRLALDRADIERLIAANPQADMARIREYFGIFDREAELDEILRRVRS